MNHRLDQASLNLSPRYLYPSLNRRSASWFKDLTLFRSCFVVARIRRVTQKKGENSRENFSLRVNHGSFQIFIYSGLRSLDGELIYGMSLLSRLNCIELSSYYYFENELIFG